MSEQGHPGKQERLSRQDCSDGRDCPVAHGHPQGRLLVCATPIGNLRDVTLRVLDALGEADAILAEDTRVTSKLLVRYGLSKPLERYDAYVAASRTPTIVRRIEAGETLALVSDAGTPGISDPGATLIDAALAANVPIDVLPGPSAVIAALSASGLPTHPFYFGGFLPRKAGPLGRTLDALAGLNATLVFYESPRRTRATLAALAAAFPGRRGAMARELTKRHEEVVRGPLTYLAEEVAARDSLKGEVVLLVDPPVAGGRAAASGVSCAPGASDPFGVPCAPGTLNAPGTSCAPDAEDIRGRVEGLVAAGETRADAVKRVAKDL
ncbi:MAG: 16S rRNA (cytidine(1402)-2'-O)-methyltransferase, partial [Coriobacteriia bacterium]|nr:16S rRNA (cytidine(1402)-2'-O)-methyltransferase [Coriobacteriia bacterium]